MISNNLLNALRAEAQDTAGARRLTLVLEQQMELERHESDHSDSEVSNRKKLAYDVTATSEGDFADESVSDSSQHG